MSVASPSLLPAVALARDLSVRDLTDPAQGPHAIQLLVDAAIAALTSLWPACDVRIHRTRPIVPIEDNYDRLRYPADAVAREVRYTRYVSETCVLRSHTSAGIPDAVRRLASDPSPPADALVACPGIVYRRDVIDRLHTGTPHQLDLWRIRTTGETTEADLESMIETVVGALTPGAAWRTTPAVHPYTLHGREVEVASSDGTWVEIGECGLAHPEVLARAGLAGGHGLAMGLGLDRLVMLRKGAPDIRLLRSDDPRVASQMLDLAPYRPVSAHPAIRRDLSIAVDDATDGETIGDRVREALGDDAAAVEDIEVVAETAGGALPAAAAARLGLRPGQKNVLLRGVLRCVDRTLTDAEANALRDRVYRALHEGDAHLWATS